MASVCTQTPGQSLLSSVLVMVSNRPASGFFFVIIFFFLNNNRLRRRRVSRYLGHTPTCVSFIVRAYNGPACPARFLSNGTAVRRVISRRAAAARPTNSVSPGIFFGCPTRTSASGDRLRRTFSYKFGFSNAPRGRRRTRTNVFVHSPL